MDYTPISTAELMTYIFVAKAFRIAGKEHPELTDEFELLPYVCKIVKQSNNRIEIALKTGNRDVEELRDMDRLSKFIDEL